jgi:hypothetical protein
VVNTHLSLPIKGGTSGHPLIGAGRGLMAKGLKVASAMTITPV